MKVNDELKFRGKAAGYWLRLVSKSSDDERWEAVDAIRHICGPDQSIPVFLEVLGNDQFWLARALAAHALFDMAWDEESRVSLRGFAPQIESLPPDPVADVRDQLADTLSVLNDPDPWQSVQSQLGRTTTLIDLPQSCGDAESRS